MSHGVQKECVKMEYQGALIVEYGYSRSAKTKKDIINIMATLYINRLKSAPIKRGLSNLQVNA
jgi:hypothetical protein